jgi:hypothetical protein
MEILLFFHPAVTLAAAMPGGTGSEQQLQVNTPLGERCSYSGIILVMALSSFVDVIREFVNM